MKLRVFISSPGDVSEERALAVRVFQRLGAEFANSIQLEVVQWEHEPLFAHTGFQEQIERPSRCDLVVSILWSRLGTRLPSDFAPGPGQTPPTGTEYEIRDALEGYQRLGRPNLLIYRKSAAPTVNLASDQAEERLQQYRLLDEFCRHAFYNEQGAVVVAHHLYAESYEFERKLTEHVRKWLERQAGAATACPRWTSGSPYRGLQVFEAEHRDIYFGRGLALGELTKRMRETEARARDSASVTRFLLVQGMSGNGKSSLIRAGLLPLLEGRALEGIGLWRQVICKPSDRSPRHPEAGVVGALAEGLIQVLPALAESYPDMMQLADRLQSAPDESAARLDGYLAQVATRASLRSEQIRLVVFVDQLEELFNPSVPMAERTAFARILQALSREGRIWVIATLRSDFASRLEEVSELAALAGNGQVRVLMAPQPDELADIIREPAHAAGLEWESRDGVSLDQTMLREATASPESLPLLEYALDQLYDRREGPRLTYTAYEQFGGLKGGIARTAEAVLTAQEGSALAFSKLMRSLASVDESGTAMRRYSPVTELTEGTPERELLDALIARRLCVMDRRGADAVVSFAHEALIQSWPRVVDWMKDEAGLLQARDILVSETRRWEQHGGKDDWLATTPDRLASVKIVSESDIALPAAAKRFALLSQRRARRVLLVKRGAVGVIVLLLVGVATIARIAISQRDAAQRAIAAQFEARAWEAIGKNELPRALRYALASTAIVKLEAAQSQRLLAAIIWHIGGSTLLAGHKQEVYDLEFSPDGTRVVTTSADHTARVWDVATGNEIARLQHDELVWHAAFSSDGRRIATASWDKTARVWDAATGRELARLQHDDEVRQAAFSPDGQQVVTASWDKTARIWDAATGRELVRCQHDGKVQLAAFSPDGRRVVTASLDKTARIWDAATGRELVRFQHDGPVQHAVLSPDGRQVVTASDGGNPRIWDAATGRELVRFQNDREAQQAAFSPDGRQVVTGSYDGTARIWDAATGRELARFRHDGPVQQATFSPDGRQVVTASWDKTVRVWDAATGRELARFQNDREAQQAAFSPDGRQVLTASYNHTVRIWAAAGRELARLRHDDVVQQSGFTQDGRRVVTRSLDKTARVWDVATGRELARLQLDNPVWQAPFSPDGRRVVTASWDKTARVWDTASGRELARLQHDSAVLQAAFSPDGQRVVTASSDNTARVWDATTGRELARFQHDGMVLQAAFFPDGRRVLTTSGDKTARVWDVATGRELARFRHDGANLQAASSPDGRQVVTSSWDKTARVWDAATGRELARFQHDTAVLEAVFSPDGRQVVTASNDGTARIWGTATGRELVRLQPDGVVRHAAFSSDGRRVLTTSGGATARVWDAASGRELVHLQHDSAVLQAAFSPDGHQVVTASADNTARVWDVAVLSTTAVALARQACDWLPPQQHRFTATEIASEPLVRDAFLASVRADGSVCEGIDR